MDGVPFFNFLLLPSQPQVTTHNAAVGSARGTASSMRDIPSPSVLRESKARGSAIRRPSGGDDWLTMSGACDACSRAKPRKLIEAEAGSKPECDSVLVAIELEASHVFACSTNKACITRYSTKTTLQSHH